MNKIVVLYVTYGDEYSGSFNTLLNFLKNINYKYEIIIIDNKYGANSLYIPYPNGIHGNIRATIGGDNSCWEFSAWDRGLEFIKINNIRHDCILFVNDSFMNNRIKGVGGHPSTVINNESIYQCINNNKAVFTWLTTGPKYFELDGIDVSSWYRTNCFLLNRNHINTLTNIKTCDKIYIEKFISKDLSKGYFKEDAPMNETLKQFIIWRLTENWHKPIIIEENKEIFKMKTLAYFNEFFLTHRIRKANIDVIAKQ
jgi:hypothetical protein